MRRSEKGYKIALMAYAVLGGILTYAMRNDELPQWLQAFPQWVQSAVGITSIASFLIVAAYHTLDTKRSFRCISCDYKVDVHKPWPKWMKRYFAFIAFAFVVFLLLLIGLGIIMFFDLSVA